ncbi:MAG: hypothetical protein EBQ96_07575 [Proteobacteria bacterium]|nr:hypothetical protein [Pseudomonadota bacterium]
MFGLAVSEFLSELFLEEDESAKKTATTNDRNQNPDKTGEVSKEPSDNKIKTGVSIHKNIFCFFVMLIIFKASM